MKYKAKPLIIAALTAASSLTVMALENPTGEDLLVSAPDPAPISVGTAPVASVPVLNIGPGATATGVAGLIHTYSTNGSGLQTGSFTTGGGVLLETNGNVTLSQQTSQLNTTSYSIEVREIKVSNPAGYVGDGQIGAVGVFYPNGTTIPGTAINVATVRDANGGLVSVISDLPGVGPVTAQDGDGNPVLTPVQIAAAVTAGAPEGFLNEGEPVTTGGELRVAGQTFSNGIDNGGAKITNVADAENASDAVNKGQLDGEVTTLEDADTALGVRIDGEAVLRSDADAALTQSLATEASTRATEDTAIRDEFRLADSNIITSYTNQIQAEQSARVLADNQMEGRLQAADEQIRNDFQAADRSLKNDISKNTRGIAMVAAMTNTTVEEGKTHGVDFNVAQFESSTGFSFGYANRINDNVQVRAAVASSEDFEESVSRIGVSFQW